MGPKGFKWLQMRHFNSAGTFGTEGGFWGPAGDVSLIVMVFNGNCVEDFNFQSPGQPFCWKRLGGKWDTLM